jgi:hypothetical protein
VNRARFHQRVSSGARRAALLLGVGLVLAGCGKKGPPLPPLRLVPAPATDMAARRTGSEVELRFTLPTRNQNGPGPVALDRIEIYAVTMPPGAPPVANRDLLTKARLVGTVPVRPQPEEGEEAPVDPTDKRPAPGEQTVFIEELTPEKLKPVAAASQEASEAAAPPAPTPAAAPDYPVRVYALRGVTRGGRQGPPAPRVIVPLVPMPPPPGAVDVTFTEALFLITWVPPVMEGNGSLAFNVYRAPADRIALNQAPLTAAAFELGPVRFGEEQCFVVRSVRTVQTVMLESAPSDGACATPRDVFAPAAPRGLQAVAGPDGISLSWNANAEADLAGYVVLRGEAPGDTLQPLTPGPIAETNYRDTTAQSGVRYVYALVAVDTATPPNTSAQSERQEVTAR